MRQLRAGFVECAFDGAERRLAQIRQRQGKIVDIGFAEHEPGEVAAEAGAGCDAAATIAADRISLAAMTVEARQCVVGHADLAEPGMVELDFAERREQPGKRPARPAAMNRQAASPQRPDAAEDEAAGLVEAEGGQDLIGVPYP